MLDELTTSGEVSIVGAGKAGARDPWIMLLPSDYAAELAPIVDVTLTPTQQAVVDLLARGGGLRLLESATARPQLAVQRHARPAFGEPGGRGQAAARA